jgi:hypothetical protein
MVRRFRSSARRSFESQPATRIACLHRQTGLTHARSAPEHDQRPAAGKRTVDDLANRETFRFPPHESGALRERERRYLQRRQRGLRMVDTRWGAIAT